MTSTLLNFFIVPSLYLARLTRPNAGAIVGSRIDH